MSLIVLLDAGPLGMITNPKSSPENEACKNWLASLAPNSSSQERKRIAHGVSRGEVARSRSPGTGRKIAAGYPPGARFREMLRAAEDAQLEGTIATADEALK